MSKLVVRAICLLTATLDSLHVPYQVTGDDRLIIGDQFHVQFVMEKPKPISTGLQMRPHVILSQNLSTFNWGLNKLLTGAGFEQAHWHGRGPPPKTRVYGDDMDRVIFRESVFRRTINPAPEIWADLKNVIDIRSKVFWRINERLCVSLGFDLDDLMTYARVWTVNFWCTGRKVEPLGPSENKKMLQNFLNQRFQEFYQQMSEKRGRAVNFTASDVAMAMGVEFRSDSDRGNPNGPLSADAMGPKAVAVDQDFFKDWVPSYRHMSPNDRERWKQFFSDLRAPDRVQREPLRDQMNVALDAIRCRRAAMAQKAILKAKEEGNAFSQEEEEFLRNKFATMTDRALENGRVVVAKKMLREKLAELPHDRLVEVLGDTAASEFSCPDTKREALRQLKQHRVKCSEGCSAPAESARRKRRAASQVESAAL